MYAQPATEVSVIVDVHTGTSHRLDQTKEDEFNGKSILLQHQGGPPQTSTVDTNESHLVL
ncbi:hypothetical protein E4U30_005722 [Claviceps sp. LM220 group G6]|nr:hypothetical protein E4U30_005722 [Claviceps sp. LM220 group G6]